MRVVQEPPQLRIQTLSSSGTEAADLTAVANGLSFSSTNPGGDERCTFELKRKWFAGAPEIAQGKLVRILDGPDILFQGRIDENDRRVADSEAIGVAAYGLGVRLKDDETYRQIFVDRDLGQWGEMPLNERLRLATASVNHGAIPFTQEGQTLSAPVGGVALVNPSAGSRWYTMPPGLAVGKVMYRHTSRINVPMFNNRLLRVNDQDQWDGTTEDHVVVAGGALTTFTVASPQRYLWYDVSTFASATPDAGAHFTFTTIAVYGTHGLTTRAISGEPDGVYASDVVRHVIGLVSGVTARHVDDSTFVVTQLAFRDGVTHEQAIVEASKYENPGVDWGVWAPDSVLDPSLDGQFDWKAKDPTTQHWYALRSDCDDVALNVEMATLYNEVDVSYQDAAGIRRVVNRGAAVAVLDENGIVRRAKLDGGTLTQAGAQQLGDAFLALSAQRPPARGTVQLSAPVRHYQRGKVWPHRMRADGANLRLPDVLPSEDALSLTAAPDRLTTFPIKRVSIDASGPVPKTTVDVDQTNDTLALLQARLQLAAQLTLGR